jgi:hypothetical protein
MRWEYCLLTCTPMSGLDDGGGRVRCQIIAPEGIEEVDISTGAHPPLVGLGQILNQLGQDGWELIAYDTTTHRGVLKRPLAENGERT